MRSHPGTLPTRLRLLLAALVCTAVLASPAYTAEVSDQNGSARPEFWAQPLQVEGVHNLYKVSDDFYRSAQPTADSMRSLEELGVRTVISVRFFHTGRRPTEGTDLAFERIAIKPWHTKEKQVVEFLQIATDPERAPVLLHCYKGADRTSMLAAMYRIVVQGWTKEAAIEEMKLGGYGFNSLWSNLIRWIKKADIESIREAAGVPPPNTSTSASTNTSSPVTLPGPAEPPPLRWFPDRRPTGQRRHP
jgi:protein tyrosine phosphatase (PTP) superfamily phosphohydrolase (DUF442 family)